MTPVKQSGNAKPAFHAPSPGVQSTRFDDSSHIGSWSAPAGPKAAQQLWCGSCVEKTRVVEVKKGVNVDSHEEDPPAYFLVGPRGPIARVDQNKHGLGDDDSMFAKLLCDTMIEAQPALRGNTYLTEDALALIAMNVIRDVRALDIPYAEQPKEIIYRLKEPMIQALNEAKAKELEHAHNESVTLTADPNCSPTTPHQEANSEETDSSEETTAGFIIDIWWSAVRETKIIKNLACGPETSNSIRKRNKTLYDRMAVFITPTATGNYRRTPCDCTGKCLARAHAPTNSTTPAACKRSYLPNVWRDATKDKEASGATSPAPTYPRVPFTPIRYDRHDFPMLHPIQHLTDAQVQAIKGATAEAKMKE